MTETISATLDDCDGKGEHEGAKRLAYPVRHHLGVPDGREHRGD